MNEQPREYWVERFAGAGMRYRRDLAEQLSTTWRAARVQSWWLPENVMVFERAVSPGGAVPISGCLLC